MTKLDDIMAAITPALDALKKIRQDTFYEHDPLMVYTNDAVAIYTSICDAIDSLEDALDRVEELIR